MSQALIVLAAMVLAAAPPPVYPAAGRPVAGIVSPAWGDSGARDRAHETAQIVRALHLKSGATLADIGAGNGYETLRLARVIGPHGAVFAEDIEPAYLDMLRAKVAEAGLGNVHIVLGAPDDPRLPPRSVDAVIMVHMYHEIAEPFAMLGRLAPTFRRGGRLGIEEGDRPTTEHGTPPKLLTCELAAAGYRQLSLAPMTGGLGYFAVFAPPEAGTVADPKAVAACHA